MKKNTPKKKKDPMKRLFGEMPQQQGTFEEVRTAFERFGTALTPEQEERLKGLLKKKRKS